MPGPYVSLQQILGAPNLCGIIKLAVDGIVDPLEKAFYDVEKVCHGNTGQYTAYTGARQLATISDYGQPSKTRQLRDLQLKPVVLLHSIENIQLDPIDYMNLFAYDDLARQKMGIMEVKRQVGYLSVYQKNLRIASWIMALFWGQLYWDTGGNLLPPDQWGNNYGNGVNYGVPITNTGQLQDVNGAAIIGDSWSDPACPIIQQLTVLKQTAIQRTGYPIKRAYYGANISQYLANNTSVQAYLARSTMRKDSEGDYLLEEGEIRRLFGIDFKPAYESYFLDANDTPQQIVGPDQVTFTPEPSPAWCGLLEGTYPVPEFANIITPVEQIMANGMPQIETPGQFAYGVQTADPSGVKVVYGDTFLPIVKIPRAIYLATTAVGQTS